MKNLFLVGLCTLLLSCGTSKKTVMTPAVESSRTTTVNLEGEKVISETVKLTGIEMVDALNEDGTEMVKRPYKWYAGTGKADNKQVAIELAQREAYATISRVFENAVYDNADRNNIVNTGKVVQSLRSHWEQVSSGVQKGCEPFGNTTIEYNPSTQMYEVTAKIGVRGDHFNKLLNTAGEFKPSDLTGSELEQFIKTNKMIRDAVIGK